MKITIILLTLFGLVSCGDSSSSGSSAAGGSASITGKFIDDPVVGLKYVSDDREYFTDSEGDFECIDGESVEFYMGNLLLGSATCGKVLTPFDIRGTQDLNDNGVANVALLLQNLDDGSDGSKLTIPVAYHDEDFSTIVLSEANDANFVSAFDALANIPSASVTTKAAARTTLISGVSAGLNNKSISFVLNTDDTCDAMDEIPVTGSFSLDTSGGANAWTFGSGYLSINEHSFPLAQSAVTSVGAQTLHFTNNLLPTYQGPSSPNSDLVGNPWLCDGVGQDDSSGSGILSAFNAVIELTFVSSNRGQGVLKENFTCGGVPVSNTCGSFSFTVE